MHYYILILLRGLHACEIISLEHAMLDTADPTHKRVYYMFLFNISYYIFTIRTHTHTHTLTWLLV